MEKRIQSKQGKPKSKPNSEVYKEAYQEVAVFTFKNN